VSNIRVEDSLRPQSQCAVFWNDRIGDREVDFSGGDGVQTGYDALSSGRRSMSSSSSSSSSGSSSARNGDNDNVDNDDVKLALTQVFDTRSDKFGLHGICVNIGLRSIGLQVDAKTILHLRPFLDSFLAYTMIKSKNDALKTSSASSASTDFDFETRQDIPLTLKQAHNLYIATTAAATNKPTQEASLEGVQEAYSFSYSYPANGRSRSKNMDKNKNASVLDREVTPAAAAASSAPADMEKILSSVSVVIDICTLSIELLRPADMEQADSKDPLESVYVMQLGGIKLAIGIVNNLLAVDVSVLTIHVEDTRLMSKDYAHQVMLTSEFDRRKLAKGFTRKEGFGDSPIMQQCMEEKINDKSTDKNDSKSRRKEKKDESESLDSDFIYEEAYIGAGGILESIGDDEGNDEADEGGKEADDTYGTKVEVRKQNTEKKFMYPTFSRSTFSNRSSSIKNSEKANSQHNLNPFFSVRYREDAPNKSRLHLAISHATVLLAVDTMLDAVHVSMMVSFAIIKLVNICEEREVMYRPIC